MTLQEQIRLILDTNIYANYSCDGWSSIDGKDEAIAKLIELMITNRDEAAKKAWNDACAAMRNKANEIVQENEANSDDGDDFMSDPGQAVHNILNHPFPPFKP